MNKIEKLIAQLCPNGVEFNELKHLGSTFSGLSGKSKSDFTEGNARYITYLNVSNNISVDTTRSDFVKVRNKEKQNQIRYGDVLLTGSSETPNEVGMSSVVCDNLMEPIFLNSFCFGFRFNDVDLFDPRFLKYLFRAETLRKQIIKCANGVTRFNISKKRFLKIFIPIPPLEIQQEIVNILDTFSELEAELKVELNAELEARRKQYQYYRDELLNFSGALSSIHNQIGLTSATKVSFRELQEVFDIKNGYTPSKKNYDYWNNGTIPWFRMEDIRKNGRVLNDSIQHVTPEAVKGGRLFPANSLIIATTATIGEHALITADSLANQQFTFLTQKVNRAVELDMKFMFYYGYILGEWCKKNINAASFASVDMKKFRKFRIPIPPLKIQQEIVSILDKFDALVNDLSIGIPAEIAARRKQYEYYRDKLLTFKEAV